MAFTKHWLDATYDSTTKTITIPGAKEAEMETNLELAKVALEMLHSVDELLDYIDQNNIQLETQYGSVAKLRELRAIAAPRLG